MPPAILLAVAIVPHTSAMSLGPMWYLSSVQSASFPYNQPVLRFTKLYSQTNDRHGLIYYWLRRVIPYIRFRLDCFYSFNILIA